MKKYIGTKIIEAKPGTMAEAQALKGGMPIKQAKAMFRNSGTVDKDGYVVQYEDGYVSWSPKEAFENAYRQCDNMTFGLALEALKKGYKVARKGWNGDFMFIYIQDESRCYTEDLRNSALKDYCKDRVIQHVKINPHIDMKAADGSIVIGWLASQTDMLAEDWVIVE